MSFHRQERTVKESYWSKASIRFSTFCAAVAVASFASLSTLAEQSDKERLLDRIVGMETFQANFLQRTLESDGREIQQQKGSFVLKRPGNFLWEVDTPFQQTIVIRDRDVSIFDPDLEQLIKQRLDDLEEASLATLLTELDDPLEMYEVSQSGDIFTLRPASENEFLVEMRLSFEVNTLHRVEVIDAFDNTTVFNFYNTKLNEAVDDAVFELDVPEGTDVIIQEGDLDTTEI